MSKPIKPVLRPWSDLSSKERSPRDFAENGGRSVDVIYILDPARIVAEVQAGGEPSNVAKRCRYNSLACKVWILNPPPGHGDRILRVLVGQPDPNNGGTWTYYASSAKGGGYDKLTAALEGCPILAAGADVALGDHCDHLGRPTLRDLCDARGWMVLGDLS